MLSGASPPPGCLLLPAKFFCLYITKHKPVKTYCCTADVNKVSKVVAKHGPPQSGAAITVALSQQNMHTNSKRRYEAYPLAVPYVSLDPTIAAAPVDAVFWNPRGSRCALYNRTSCSGQSLRHLLIALYLREEYYISYYKEETPRL